MFLSKENKLYKTDRTHVCCSGLPFVIVKASSLQNFKVTFAKTYITFQFHIVFFSPLSNYDRLSVLYAINHLLDISSHWLT